MAKFKACTKIFVAALNLIQAALAILVVVLVSWKMMNVTRQGLRVNAKCLLDGTGKTGRLRGTEFCIYAIAVGLVSLIATAILRCANSCLGCMTANACGITNLGSMLIDIVMFAWWALAFALFVNRGVPANNAKYPHEHERNIIIAAAFGNAASFALSTILTACGLASR